MKLKFSQLAKAVLCTAAMNSYVYIFLAFCLVTAG